MRVRVNSVYYYLPNLLDRIDGRTSLKSGDMVRVKNMHGCPKANTMEHCHVVHPVTGQFIGLVHCNSLHTKAEYVAYLRKEIARMSPVTEIKNSPVVWASSKGSA